MVSTKLLVILKNKFSIEFLNTFCVIPFETNSSGMEYNG